MPIAFEPLETRCVVRLEGEIGVSDAGELKRLLVAVVASGRQLQLDLEHTDEIDVTCMQLLQAALLQTGRTGMTVRLSETAETALRGAGFGPCIEAAGWSH